MHLAAVACTQEPVCSSQSALLLKCQLLMPMDSVIKLQAHRVHMASGCRLCPSDGGDAQQWLSRLATTSRAAL